MDKQRYFTLLDAETGVDPVPLSRRSVLLYRLAAGAVIAVAVGALAIRLAAPYSSLAARVLDGIRTVIGTF